MSRKYSIERRRQAFWGKVLIKEKDECWLWLGAKGRSGYGNFKDGERTVGAHVFAYEIENGKIPSGMYGCHTCDNPSCVNPRHILPGTPTHNQLDCVIKGRRIPALGSKSSNSKLTEDQVALILSDTRCKVTIAKQYGVTAAAIRNIKFRKSWPHVPLPDKVEVTRNWTPEKIEKLIEMKRKQVSEKEIAKHFNKTPSAVRQCLKRLKKKCGPDVSNPVL